MMRRYTELKVWQRGQPRALAIDRSTEGFPEKERCGLTAQLRRAAVSVPANNAEGSLAEAGCRLLLSRDLGYLEPKPADKLRAEVEEIGRMLFALRSQVEGGRAA